MQKDGIPIDKMLISCYSESEHMISIANPKSLARRRRDRSPLAGPTHPAPKHGRGFRVGRIVRFPFSKLASIQMHFNANSLPLRSSGRRFPGCSALFRDIPATSTLSLPNGLADRPRKSTPAPADPTFRPQSNSNLIRPNQTFDFFSGRNPLSANPACSATAGLPGALRAGAVLSEGIKPN